MPKSKPGTTNRRGADPRRFEVSKSSAQIVKNAKALLDEELAAGIVVAKQVQRRFRKQGRIDPADISHALKPFQADAHEVIALLNDRLDEMRSQENGAMTWSMWPWSWSTAAPKSPTNSELSQREANNGTPCRPQTLTVTRGKPGSHGASRIWNDSLRIFAEPPRAIGCG